MPEISVIVPVYKVEKYIHRCIDSILNQTFRDFELILVDDGSPDNCGAICDEYVVKDCRIRVIHKENKGVSAARNDAAALAVGRYITFIDSDDWVRQDFLQVLYDNLKDYHADISIMGIQYVSCEDTQEELVEETVSSYTATQAIKCLGEENKCRFRGPMAKLILSDIVRKYPFPTDRAFAEDMAVVYKWYSEAGIVVNSNYEKYCYFQNDAGVTRSGYSKTRLGNLKTLSELLCYLDTHHYEKLYKQFTCEYLYDLCKQHQQVSEYLQDCAIADEIKKEIKRVYVGNRKRCGLSIRSTPWAINLLFPVTAKMYWRIIKLMNCIKSCMIAKR